MRAALAKEPQWNGGVAVIGFCYGGPYTILGPKRLGYDAGIACHGTQMLDFLPELEGMNKPVCVIWGDEDIMAPPPVLEAYKEAAKRLNIGRSLAYRFVQSGALPSIKIAGARRILVTDLEAFATGRK